MRNKMDRLLEKILIILMVLMVADVVWQVFSRYIIRTPSTFTDELAGFLLIWLGMLGAAYASGKGQHLAIEILPNKLNATNRVRLDIFINLMVIFFALPVMLVGGTHLVYLTFLLEQRSATLGIPLGYIYLCVPLSGLFITVYSSFNIKDKIVTSA